jgi:molybdenum cofactor biosynthesis enzyme MoaA
VRTDDFIHGPTLLDSHRYISFVDIGFNILKVNRVTGIEENKIQEGVALVEEFKGKVSFIELQIKVV